MTGQQPQSSQPQPTSTSEYVSGTWVAMAMPGTWVLVDAGSSTGPWARCWLAMRESHDVHSVLAVIADAEQTTAPDFGVVHCDGTETRVVARGSLSVELAYEATSMTVVHAPGRIESTDRLFAGMPFALRLANASQVEHAGHEAVMPLASGVVRASVVGVGLDTFGRPSIPCDADEVDVNLDGFLVRVDDGSPTTRSGLEPQPVPEHGLEPDISLTTSARQAPITTPSASAPNAAPISAPITRDSTADELSGLPLDDLSWLGGQSQPFPGTAPDPVIPATAPAPPAATPPVDPVPFPESGLSFDAEATTFRPGRAPVQLGAGDQSTVLAVFCPSGHANQPRTLQCRTCRLPIAAEQQPRAVVRPALGRLRLASGEVHVLDRGFLLGRNPVPRATATGPEPNVLRLISQDGDVSRTHAEIRLEGWQVVVADLGSMNGTYVSGPDLPARVLSGGEEQIIEPGCVVTLAHDVWIAYEAAE